MKTTKKPAKELKAGDVILPPAAERKWLKADMNVLGVEEGAQPRGQKAGEWLKVTASFVSPYRQEGSSDLSQMNFFVRPTTLVSVKNVGVA